MKLAHKKNTHGCVAQWLACGSADPVVMASCPIEADLEN